MSEKPVTPSDYLPIAREVIRRREELLAARDGEDVADRDQTAAAAKDAYSQTEQLVEAVERLEPGTERLSGTLSEVRALAWRLAMAGAFERRVPPKNRCPHADPHVPPRPLTALLTSRLFICQDCASRYAARANVEDDGRCDVCDRPGQEFSEFAGNLGHLRIIGNVCHACRFFMGG